MKTITRKMVVPDWAGWMAQETDGDWVVFEFVPVKTECGWDAPDGKSKTLYRGLQKNKWSQTLVRI